MKWCKSGANRILKVRALRFNQVLPVQSRIIVTAVDLAHGADRSNSHQKCAQILSYSPPLPTVRGNNTLTTDLSYWSRHRARDTTIWVGVIIHCIFNVSLSALHFSLPTKSWYFHALSSVQFFILMSGFQCVLLFCFFGGGVLKHQSAAPDDIKIIQVAAFCYIYGECCRDTVTGMAALHKHCVSKHENSN